MKRNSINPVMIVQEHVNELKHQYRTTADPQKKEVLERRLHNLQNVLEFLSGTQNGMNNAGNYA